MAAKIDKTRIPKTGELSYIGTGVAAHPEAVEEKVDLAQFIQDMISDALSNIERDTVGDQTVENTYSINNITGGVTEADVWNMIGEYNEGIQIQLEIMREGIDIRFGDVWDEIANIWNAIAAGGGVKVFRYSSQVAGIAGRYNCQIVSWIAGAWVPVNVNVTVICQNVTEDSGYAFTTGQLFFGLGRQDLNGVHPVAPILLGVVRAVITQNAAQAGGVTITANLLGDPLSPITITCDIIGGTGNETLFEAVPLLTKNDVIYVEYDSTFSGWRNVTTLHSAAAGGGWFFIESMGGGVGATLTCTPLDGDLNPTGGDPVSIAIHPQSDADNYAVSHKIYAAKTSGVWTAVSFFSDPLEFVGNQLKKCAGE